MKTKLIKVLFAVGLAATTMANAASITLTFDEVTPELGIPAEMQGFQFSSGWLAGDGYVYTESDAVSITRTDGALFDFEGALFAAPSATSESPITLTAIGKQGGHDVGSLTIAITSQIFTQIDSDPVLSGLDELVFVGLSGVRWEMDTFQDSVMPAVPEPATIAAASLLLLPFGISAARIMRRRRKA